MSPADPLLVAVDLGKSFPLRGGLWRRAAGQVAAVQDVSVRLAPGEAFGLVGESGSGKSTLAKLLVGLLAPTRGIVQVGGHDLRAARGSARLAVCRTVQLIFQDPAGSLNPRMTVDALVGEPLVIHRLAGSAAQRRQRVDALLDAVRLPARYAGRLPHELSGGERQRVGIARALAVEPKALICDEPVAALDVSVGAQILALLRGLHRERGMALIFISHDLGAVASLCEHLAVMRAGRVVEEGPTEDVLRQPKDPYTRLLLHSARLDLDASSPAAPGA